MASLIDNRNSFAVNGVRFPAQKIRNNWESLATEDSGRTLDGVMHIYWVFEKINKVEITLPPCNGETVQRLIDAVQGRIYTLTWFDPGTNSVRSMQCYTSNSHADMYSGIIRNGLWEKVTFNAIQIQGDR